MFKGDIEYREILRWAMKEEKDIAEVRINALEQRCSAAEARLLAAEARVMLLVNLVEDLKQRSASPNHTSGGTKMQNTTDSSFSTDGESMQPIGNKKNPVSKSSV